MGLTLLGAFLKRHRRIALDTSIFIYYMEENPTYVDLAEEVFAWIERSPSSGVTSTITMTELLAAPYRDDDVLITSPYYALLSTFPNLDWVAPDLAISDTAARIRAVYRLRTPDALQVATAIRSDADAILTNDATFARVTEIDVGVLDRLL